MLRYAVAIYCMIIASCLPIVFAGIAKLSGGFRAKDNQTPRDFLANLSGLAARANAVQANSFETLPVFLAGVVLAMVMVVPQGSINRLAIAYVILRIGYGLAYLANWSRLRSVLWLVSFACALLLMVFAGRPT